MFFGGEGLNFVTLRKTYIENTIEQGAEECSDAEGRK